MFLSERKEIDEQIANLQRQRGVLAEADRTLQSYGLEGLGCDETHYQNAHFSYDFYPGYVRNVVDAYDKNIMGNFMGADGQVEIKKILYRA